MGCCECTHKWPLTPHVRNKRLYKVLTVRTPQHIVDAVNKAKPKGRGGKNAQLIMKAQNFVNLISATPISNTWAVDVGYDELEEYCTYLKEFIETQKKRKRSVSVSVVSSPPKKRPMPMVPQEDVLAEIRKALSKDAKEAYLASKEWEIVQKKIHVEYSAAVNQHVRLISAAAKQSLQFRIEQALEAHMKKRLPQLDRELRANMSRELSVLPEPFDATKLFENTPTIEELIAAISK